MLGGLAPLQPHPLLTYDYNAMYIVLLQYNITVQCFRKKCNYSTSTSSIAVVVVPVHFLHDLLHMSSLAQMSSVNLFPKTALAQDSTFMSKHGRGLPKKQRKNWNWYDMQNVQTITISTRFVTKTHSTHAVVIIQYASLQTTRRLLVYTWCWN